VAYGSKAAAKACGIYCLSVQVTRRTLRRIRLQNFRFRSESDQRSAGQVQEAAVGTPSLGPEKDGSAGQVRGFASVWLMNGCLTLQRLGSATTGLLIVIERRIDDLGEKLRNARSR